MTPLSLAHLAPGSAFRLLIVCALALHIAGGSIGIVSGYAAILARKGGGLHRRAGLAFTASMVVMGAMAMILAVRIPQRGNIAGGLLAAYLVTTGWMAMRRDTNGRRFEIGAGLFALALALVQVGFGLEAQASPGHRLDGYPPAPYFVFAAITASLAWGDLRLALNGGRGGRLARHIGRMGLALFFAAASFFLGQQKVMPAFMRGSPALLLLGLAPLGLTVFWLVRIRLSKRRPRAALRPAADVAS
ncbi:MAG TPA: hypothetical protein VFW19_03015 [Allosphingosinicella sp.]|nr:hypothetical protein [Allosphingosinicella sp.]